MIPQPTGRLVDLADRGEPGVALVVARTLPVSTADAWAFVTEPERTAAWFGPWTGEARAGAEIDIVLAAEEGAPTTRVTIAECEPGRRVRLLADDEHGSWDLSLEVAEAEAGVDAPRAATVTLIHRLDDVSGVGDIGPGWEFYLDRLAAAVDGSASLPFDAYYPAQREHYVGLAAAR